MGSLAGSAGRGLGTRGVEVHTFEAWARAEARRIFADLPERDSVDATAAVIRLKRHPALRPLLAERARRARTQTTRRRDLLHLFGDRAVLERVVEAAAGGLPRHAIAETAEHTHVQFLPTTERVHRHVDRERLDAVDGRTLDAGTPLEDVESLDAEDCAVLFELRRLRGGPRGAALRTYDHVVVDEAQELAPIELAMIAEARGEGGAITVAGDENQQVDDTNTFAGWPEVMRELRVAEHEVVVLRESYRCPAAVTAFARSLIDRTGGPRAVPPDSGAALVATRLPTPVHLHARLVEELRALEAADPRIAVAVICRTAEAARKLHASLARVLAVRLALAGDLDLGPGTVVTSVAEMKGLEVDVVIVPDADAVTYAGSEDARRALYVAVTRATHQVWLLAAGAWSPLVGL